MLFPNSSPTRRRIVFLILCNTSIECGIVRNINRHTVIKYQTKWQDANLFLNPDECYMTGIFFHQVKHDDAYVVQHLNLQ